mmetsp:Transcript_34326/g.106573  ORF Transcript_34326/g.106573 Transcript_34326/m.106573 type:complete len:143 (+) Transcript_34326:3-431(+)
MNQFVLMRVLLHFTTHSTLYLEELKRLDNQIVLMHVPLSVTTCDTLNQEKLKWLKNQVALKWPQNLFVQMRVFLGEIEQMLRMQTRISEPSPRTSSDAGARRLRRTWRRTWRDSARRGHGRMVKRSASTGTGRCIPPTFCSA